MTQALIVGIAGGSGSGKTTVADAIRGRTDGIAFIQHDSYYRHRPHLSAEERAAVNYDHPDSLETELLVSHLVDLRAGRPANVPVYDFAEHLRSSRTATVRPSAAIMVEGILVLADADLRKQFGLKIFVDTESDIRLSRRLKRDVNERGRTVASVLDQWFETVRPMHRDFVEPSKRYADLIIPEGYNPSAVDTVLEMIKSRLAEAPA